METTIFSGLADARELLMSLFSFGISIVGIYLFLMMLYLLPEILSFFVVLIASLFVFVQSKVAYVAEKTDRKRNGKSWRR